MFFLLPLMYVLCPTDAWIWHSFEHVFLVGLALFESIMLSHCVHLCSDILRCEPTLLASFWACVLTWLSISVLSTVLLCFSRVDIVALHEAEQLMWFLLKKSISALQHLQSLGFREYFLHSFNDFSVALVLDFSADTRLENNALYFSSSSFPWTRL